MLQHKWVRRSARAHWPGWLALAPALGLTLILFGASVIYGLAQSVGYLSFLDSAPQFSLNAYRNLMTGQGYSDEFWPALGFSLWVSGAATVLSMGLALGVSIWLMSDRSTRRVSKSADTLILNINLAFPHLVWAIGLLLLLSQSGLIARLAATFGWIQTPADFPVLVRDRYGLGIILHYVSKEVPFLALIVLAVLRSQVEAYDLVALNLGANRWQRLRYVTLPLVLKGLLGGGTLVFAFIFGAYEVPAILGVRFPRMLANVGLDFFANPDLRSRAEGMAISVLMAVIVVIVVVITRRMERHAQN